MICTLLVFFAAIHVSLSWVQDFQKRKTIVITNLKNKRLSDYHIEVIVNTTMINFSPDCYDITFTDEDDTSLSFFLESGCRTNETVFLVEVKSIDAFSELNIFMYSYDPLITSREYGQEWTSVFGYPSTQTCGNGGSIDWDEFIDYFPLGYSEDVISNLTKYYGNDTDLNFETNHTHYYPPKVNTTDSIDCDWDGSGYDHYFYIPCVSHLHEITFDDDGEVTYGDFLPQHKTFIYCHENVTGIVNRKTRSIPPNVVSFFEHNQYLEDWIDEDDINSGKMYISGSDSYGEFGGTESHNHTIPKIVDMIVYNFEGHSVGDYYEADTISMNHAHQIPAGNCKSDNSLNEPPYASLNIRKSTRLTRFVPGMIMMVKCDNSTHLCELPVGWSVFKPLEGRFPRGTDSPSQPVSMGGPLFHTHSYSCLLGLDPFYGTDSYYGDGGSEGCNYNHRHIYSGGLKEVPTLPNFKFSTYIQRVNNTGVVNVTIQPGYTYCCFGIKKDLYESVCSGWGVCTKHDECHCEEYYYGENCNITSCLGYLRNESNSVCSGHGDCYDYDKCKCEDFYYEDFCNITKCFDIFSNDTNVCSRQGKCSSKNKCECFDHYYGIECSIKECFGILSNETTEVCNGYGICEDYNTCECTSRELYFGEFCNETTCYGYLYNDTMKVCSGHGQCIGYDDCECPFSNYNESEKCAFNCFDIIMSLEDDVCSGHGECYDFNNCSCTSGDYTGIKCNFFTCHNISVFDQEEVCNGHGSCIDVDLCLCRTGYSSSTLENPCDEWYCGEFYKTSQNACNQRGTCIGSHECYCKDNYEGNLCQTWSCGYEHTDPNACSGNGICVKPDSCECENGYIGEDCSTNIYLATIMAPILSVAGITFFIILGIIFSIILCCVCCLVLTFFVSLCLLCLLISILGCITCLLNLRIKKFAKLKNFDILMKEQEMEEDSSIAHIQVNQTLFEVPFDEVKIERILGEGGSNSVVYLAKWSGSEIAFKCFKTRQLCSSQDQFDEFEREVQIMSSINHPNIVQFLGASLNPPRVGILMEFCENGEIVQFFRKYRNDDEENNSYPLFEKIRMMGEIASCFDYLHSRSIIHRDLKSENVLLDGKESCKVMDFGLSRLVDRMSQAKTTRIGTAVYMAPEIINNANYDEKCDVFSFAILMFIMITENERPYEGLEDDSFGIEFKVSNDASFRPKISNFEESFDSQFQENQNSSENSEEIRKWLVHLVRVCWDHDPEKRFGFDKLSENFQGRIEEYNQKKKFNEEGEKNRRLSSVFKDNSVIEEIDGYQNQNQMNNNNNNNDSNIISTEKEEKEVVEKIVDEDKNEMFERIKNLEELLEKSNERELEIKNNFQKLEEQNKKLLEELSRLKEN